MMKRKISFKVQVQFFALLIFTLLLVAGCGGGGNGESGGTIKLAWDPNTESDLAGYRVYYGTSSGVYDNSVDAGMGTPSGGLVTYSLTNLAKGQTYCIAVTAHDTAGIESQFSNEVCGTAG
jgi:fibronectin type 3 domain-containing protein